MVLRGADVRYKSAQLIMRDWNDTGSSMRAKVRNIGFVLACSLVSATTAMAQEAPAAPPPASTAPPANQPGFLDAIGRWFDGSKAKLDEQMKNTGDAAKSAADAAGQAAGAIVGLPGSRVVTGRQRCPPAANGAPDCTVGAEAMCRAKGFGSGRHLEVSSTESCKPKIRFTDKPRFDRNCSTETFVTRAVCQ